MRLITLSALVAVAAPAAAQTMPPSLPFAPRGVDYVETVCTGGFDGRYEQVRVLASGRIAKVTRRAPEVKTARASRGEVARIMRELDIARFDRRTSSRLPRRIADGVECALTRRQLGRTHSVTLQPEAASLPAWRDLFQVVEEVNALGRRATGAILRPAGVR
ncbi:hypothetical protein [Sphingomonas sp.]|jgi:hypothetical protein|uniref:hypothetical protein n=1 Tax=Sphingomonas sp. TaxID=28214 RepID=UPI002E30CEFF|nr:hypothetical protein [Sphingomonas sp.]HEX4693204.1 hypothetical protein [Sphingomonas sp.]